VIPEFNTFTAHGQTQPLTDKGMITAHDLYGRSRWLTPRISGARRAYALRLAESGKVNLKKNLAGGVGCMRLAGSLWGDKACQKTTPQPRNGFLAMTTIRRELADNG
jgi:hypothetical protein